MGREPEATLLSTNITVSEESAVWLEGGRGREERKNTRINHGNRQRKCENIIDGMKKGREFLVKKLAKDILWLLFTGHNISYKLLVPTNFHKQLHKYRFKL